ncbi:MAG: potassium-transporting ATPase subunit A, partial [Acidobacteria bacterium]|nr:potassium-transporting ATPase subunit A [Acidobacteriota bacterium]
MTQLGFLNIALFFALVLVLTPSLGLYMAHVFEGRRTVLSFALRPIEQRIYRLGGFEEKEEQSWAHYSFSLLAFSFVSFLFVYVLQRTQGWLPLNPMGFGTSHAPANAIPITPDLAFNTAVSFVTNTNWQSYGGEATLSYFVQMAALTVQNFASAAVGVAVAIALVRGFARQQSGTIGNFWVDLTRSVLYIFLPLSLLLAMALVAQGVPQNLNSYTKAETLEHAAQTIAQGPIASQEAIKMLGTNGGGFLNANSATPFENPTPLSNWLEMLAIFVISAGLTYTFGVMVKDKRQGWALFAAMSILFLAGVFTVYAFEQKGNLNLTRLGVENHATDKQAGGNMEGKEVRFGIVSSALFATTTTDASCGAVNSMHDSFTPIGGLALLFNIHLGELIFGGVGAGLYGILLFAILAVFIAGLMVGRTPEYLSKKIEQKEVKMAMLAM